MRIGSLELRIEKKETVGGNYYQYAVLDHRTGETITFGFRPTENQAREAGLEDAHLIRQFA